MCASKNRLEVYKDLIPIRYAKRIECEANKRGLVYNLTLEDLYTKYTTQQKRCAISGVELNMPLVNLYRYEKNKNFVNSKNFTASLDRIDSSKGYAPDNVQWVHKGINKSDKPNVKRLIDAQGADGPFVQRGLTVEPHPSQVQGVAVLGVVLRSDCKERPPRKTEEKKRDEALHVCGDVLRAYRIRGRFPRCHPVVLKHEVTHQVSPEK